MKMTQEYKEEEEIHESKCLIRGAAQSKWADEEEKTITTKTTEQ